MIISVFVRRLKEGKTYDDFRAAWERHGAFGIPTRVVTGQGLEDEREIVTIGFSDLDPKDMEAFLERVGPEESRRHEAIDEVIEGGIQRTYYLQVADDDLS